MTPLLSVRGLTKHYDTPGRRRTRALAGVSFDLAAGETLGVVGESGCGKSTLGRTMLRLAEPSAGTIRFDGVELTALGREALRRRRRHMQMIFQDPFGSLNPRHKVGQILSEPLAVHGIGTAAERRRRVAALLDTVGLGAEAADRFPHEFSGGQRQRISIARAFILEPRLVVADEPVSALDVSIQAQILNLLTELREQRDLALVMISHDLAVIRHVSDRVAVMYLGEIVELAEAAALFAAPAHPYTEALLSAVAQVKGAGRGRRIVLQGDVPDPAAPPPGCPFHTRCRYAFALCRTDKPALTARRTGTGSRLTACHLYPPEVTG